MKKILITFLIAFGCLWACNKSMAQVIISADSLNLQCAQSGTFEVPIRVSNFTDVGSFQFTLKWPPQYLSYKHIGAFGPDFAGLTNTFISFDTMASNVNQGIFTFSFTRFGGHTVATNDAIVFPVVFDYNGSGPADVEFIASPTIVEVTDPNGDGIPFSTKSGFVGPLDIELPIITCPANVDLDVSNNGVSPTSLAATAMDNCGIQSTGYFLTGATSGNYPTTADASAQVFQAGTTQVVYAVTDVGGNTSTCSFAVTVPIVDDTLTVYTSTTSAPQCGESFFVEVKVNNFDSIGSLQFSLDWMHNVLRFDSIGSVNPDFASGSFLDFNPDNSGTSPNAQLGMSWVSFNASGKNLPNATTLFRIYYTVFGSSNAASDLAFVDSPAPREALTNTTTPSSTIPVRWTNSSVMVTDNIAPTIVCPTSVTTQPDATSVNATVTGLTPSVADNCGLDGYAHTIVNGTTTTTGTFAADGIYAPGISTVTYVATDDAGNTDSCTFTVNVAMIDAAEFNIDSLVLGCLFTDTAEVCIRVKNFEPVAGVQFAVRFDDTALEYVGFSNVDPAIGGPGTFFFVSQTSSNEVRVVGSNSNGWPDLADDAPFICMRFKVLKKAATDLFIFDSPNYVFQVTDSNADVLASSSEPGLVNTADLMSPVFSNCPSDTIRVDALAGNCAEDVVWPPIIATDDCGALAFSVATHGPAGGNFPIGVTQVMYSAADSAANSAVCAFYVQINDVTAPTFANCPSDLTVDLTSGCTAAGNWTAPTAMDDCALAGPATSIIQPDSLLAIGDHTVMYVANDTSGNGHTCAFVVTVQDVTPPVLMNCPADETITLTGTDCTTTATWADPTVTDACLPANGGLTSSHTSGATFTAGTHAISFMAVDSAGNVNSCGFVLTVVDPTPPVLSDCPSDMTLYVTDTDCSAMGNWTPPTLTDACLPANGGLTTNIEPDSALVPGNYTATYTGSDVGGNTVSCSFMVTVLDTIAPTITECPDPVVSMNQIFTYNYSVPVGSDNCGTPNLSYSHFSGTTFTSDTTVVIVATDASGNTDTCSFTIDVLDCAGMTPVVTCPQNMVFEGVCDTAVVFDAPEISGYCASDTNFIVLPFGNGAPLPVGNYNITFEVNTSAGEQATCTFSLAVDETIPPVIACPGDVTVDVSGNVLVDPNNLITSATPDAACMNTIINYTNPGASDNCDGSAAVTATGPASGDTFAIGTATVTFNASDNANNAATPCEVSITVEALPELLIATAGNTICPGSDAVLTATSIPNATYVWSGPGGNFANANEITISPFSIANVGAYDLEATVNGCMMVASEAVNLSFSSAPTANDDLVSVVENESIDTINVLTNDTGVPSSFTVVMLNPANGVSQLGNGNFSFDGTETPGDIFFSYLLCDSACPTVCDTGNVVISVKNTRCEFFPNVITPNEDGINDEFLIPCLEFGDYPNNTMMIYSQWGDLVFEQSPYLWDKTTAFKGLKNNVPGAVLPDGVYYYIFRTASGDAPYKGFIQLYR